MKAEISNFLQKHFLWLLYLIVLVAGACLVRFDIIPANDTCGRYAPMAEALASGNFSEAFHPMYGTLFQFISGGFVYLFSLDGYRACQLTALLFWATALFPVYGICRYIWDKQTALTAAMLYLCCSHLQRYVYDGLRDNGRTLGILLIAYGFLMLIKTKRLLSYFLIASGGWILSALRADGFLIALVALMALWIMDMYYHKFRFYRSAAAVAVFLLLLAPQCYIVWKWTKIPMPSYRHVVIFQRIFPGKGGV